MSDITKGKDQDISTDTKPVQVSSHQALMKGPAWDGSDAYQG
jgi:hypothetical protein